MQGKFEIRRSVAILAIVLASIGGGLVASIMVTQSAPAPLFVTTAQAASSVDPSQMLSFNGVVKRAAPAVVRIDSTKVIKASEQRRQMTPLDDPFFRRFFGDGDAFPQPRDRRQEGQGSGVIVNGDGYILTNNHVVEGATTVKVALSDRREFTAKVIGTDPQTDVALLKIDATKLPFLPLSGNKPEVGDLALAIGNPFGIGQTVTMGIVSATGRNLGGRIEAYEDFIQTDAAINPGNSGGALINTKGELVGINTAIIPGGGGGNQGIGFAVPVTLAKNIMEQLQKSGKVTRGYIGALLQDVDPSLVKAFKLPNSNGAVITNVEDGTPAAKAGLKAGDVVTQINGEEVLDVASLRLKVASIAPGTSVKFHVLRDGQPQDYNVTLAERPADLEARAGRRGTPGGNDQDGRQSGLNGVSVDDITPQIARQLNLPSGMRGVVVTEVEESSAAADAGLQRGDIITQVNRQAVANTSDFDRLTRAGGNALLLVNRQGRTLFIALESK